MIGGAVPPTIGRAARPEGSSGMISDERFLRAIELFDAGEFFACHDVLEDLWSETYSDERDFLQGLIHAAVALHHFEGGNLGGARKMFDSQAKYLRPYQPIFAGVDLVEFQHRMSACFEELLQAESYPLGVQLDVARIPRISDCLTRGD